MRATQKANILGHLQRYGEISTSKAIKLYGSKCPSAVISQLRREGYYIVAKRNKDNASDTIYVLKSEAERISDEAKPKYSLSTHPKLWGVWRHMRERCRYKRHKSFQEYGGRGIKVCKEWDEAFQPFAEWAMSHGYDENAEYMQCTLDRIDCNGDYTPSNCRFVSMKIQSNNRRSNKRITYRNTTKNLGEWATLLGIPSSTLARRLKLGWGVEKAFTTPVKKQKNNRKGTWTK